MKKLSIMLAAIAISGITYGAQLELKGGFEPWREGNNSYSSFYNGGSLGAELLFNAENTPFDYGVGMEWKSKFYGGDKNNSFTEAKTFPIYLTGKYGIGEDLFYLVGRTGWSIYGNSSAKDGFYGAVGVGKEFGNFTLEALYESLDQGGSSHMYSGERANLVSIKFGYRFGENKRDVISREKDAALKAEYEKQQAEMKKLEEENKLDQERQIEEQNRLVAEKEARAVMLNEYNSLVVKANYEPNKLESNNTNESFFNDINKDLAKESGTLTVTSYTDNSGSEEYNISLSQQRADSVADQIKSNLTNEKVEIISEGLGETNFLNDNTTFEQRKANRRTEINFIAK